MKKIIFAFFIMLVVFSTAFTQTKWETKSFNTVTWQQPEIWEKLDEPSMPGTAYSHGMLVDGKQLEDGAIFAVVTDSAFAENMLKEMKEDTDTTIRVQKEDILNGLKREFYEGTIDEGEKFLTFSVAYFPNENKEREFLAIGMIKGPRTREYIEIIDQIQQTVKLTSEKKLPVKNKPMAIIVTKTTLKTDKAAYSMGEEITLTFKNVSAESNNEWIGLYKVGTEKTAYLQWRYLEAKKGGEFIFKTPEEAGEYVFRLFDQDYEELSISQPFTVKEIKLPSITLDYETYLNALPITISFNNAPAQSEKDWIAIYKVDAEDTAYISWQYLEGKKAGELTFNTPEEAGEYNFRMFSSESYNRVAVSEVFTVEKLKPPVVESNPAISENLFINEYVLCSQLVENKPEDKRVRFTFNDERIYIWLQLDKYVTSHAVKWEWIRPDDSLYDTVELNLKSASEYDYEEMNRYNIWSWLTTSSIDRANSGIWKVQFYLDDQLIITRQFMLTDSINASIPEENDLPPLQKTVTIGDLTLEVPVGSEIVADDDNEDVTYVILDPNSEHYSLCIVQFSDKNLFSNKGKVYSYDAPWYTATVREYESYYEKTGVTDNVWEVRIDGFTNTEGKYIYLFFMTSADKVEQYKGTFENILDTLTLLVY